LSEPGRQSAASVGISAGLVRYHIDLPLLVAILAVCALGVFILYSAGGENMHMVYGQIARLGVGLLIMALIAQVPPEWFRTIGPILYLLGILLLVLVLLLGTHTQGAARWLNLGVVRFQPAEIMKIAVPLTLVTLFHNKAQPPPGWAILSAFALLLVPVMLVVKQPDLGTALLIACAGLFVIFFSGMRWRYFALLAALALALTPLIWLHLHGYQRERVLTFLNPGRDPSGAGYHIIQSKIAIGSGGLFGVGWLNGTQAQLNFLPESSTDFIFAVYAEEMGLLGCLLLLALYAVIVFRGIWIAAQGRDSYTRMLAGSLSLTFFIYVFTNMGMVSGILPIVGVPLPLVSYGGSSILTLMIGFGVLMSLLTHRRLLTS
jgi:rod shape determining protein RodA